MKRIVSLIVFLICISLISPLVSAKQETTNWKLKELEFSLDIPDSYAVFTRDTPSNDPMFEEFGLTKSSLDNIMKANGLYIDAIDKDWKDEIIVAQNDTPFTNLAYLSDSMIEYVISSAKESFESIGVKLISYNTYNHPQAKFLKINIKQYNNDGTTSYGIEYFTIYNSKVITITIKTFDGKLDSSEEKIIKGIVDSVAFTTAAAYNNDTGEYPAFQYIDTATGLKFTVPAEWTQEEFSKERQFLSAKFVSNLQKGISIFYGGFDAWSILPESEKGSQRSELNNDSFTTGEISDLLGFDSVKVTKKSYGGKEYFEFEQTTTTQYYGIELEIKMVYLIRVEYGYVFSFQTNAEQGSNCYKDFLALVASAEYPIFENEESQQVTAEKIPTTYKTNQTISSSEKNEPANVILQLLVTVLIHPVPIWIYRYGIRKKPVAPKTAITITIIDAVLVAIIMAAIFKNVGALNYGAFGIWCFVCYASLKSGYVAPAFNPPKEEENNLYSKAPERSNVEWKWSEAEESSDSREEPENCEAKEEENEYTLSAPQILYCRRCGSKLEQGNKRCEKCGTEIIVP